MRFATAACMQKYGNVRFATVACAKCMRYGGRGGDHTMGGGVGNTGHGTIYTHAYAHIYIASNKQNHAASVSHQVERIEKIRQESLAKDLASSWRSDPSRSRQSIFATKSPFDSLERGVLS